MTNTFTLLAEICRQVDDESLSEAVNGAYLMAVEDIGSLYNDSDALSRLATSVKERPAPFRTVLHSLTKSELKDVCADFNVSVNGLKREIVERLTNEVAQAGKESEAGDVAIESAQPRSSQKLELTWPHKDGLLVYNYDEDGNPVPSFIKRRELDRRPLVGVEEYGEADNDTLEDANLLIEGDNLLALKTLQTYYAGEINLIYIDPPFNTGRAFEFYDDGLEHSIWLTMIRDRLKLLRSLLSEDGVIAMHIDHHEYAYLKVVADEIFGRPNYIDTLALKMRHEDRILRGDKPTHSVVEYVLLYSKHWPECSLGSREVDKDYDKYKYDVEVTGDGRTASIGGKRVQIFTPNEYRIDKGDPSEDKLQKINIRGTLKEGNSSGRFYEAHLAPRLEEDGYATLYRVPGIGADSLDYRYFMQPAEPRYKNGFYFQGVPEGDDGVRKIPYPNYIDISEPHNRVQEEGDVELRYGKKPEKLIKLLADIASLDDDALVLDSFAGSGTTGAAAHKMGYQWIMVEIGSHARTKCLPRLKRVVDGDDSTGITDEVGWQGGGGFQFCHLGDSLLKPDPHLGRLVLRPEYTNGPLIKAVCSYEGFRLTGDTILQGRAGNTYAHVTEELVGPAYLDEVRRQLPDGSSLIVYAPRVSSRLEPPEDTTVNKIPRDLEKRYLP